MTVLHYLTNAHDSYDYGCTRTLLRGVKDKHGNKYRLIAIDQNPDRGSFCRTQVARYSSGLHTTIDCAEDSDMSYYGAPPLCIMLDEAAEVDRRLTNAAMISTVREARDAGVEGAALLKVRYLAQAAAAALTDAAPLSPNARYLCEVALGLVEPA